MSGQLPTEHGLEFLSLKGGCRGFSESTLVKMPHCCKSHAAAHLTPALLPEMITLWFRQSQSDEIVNQYPCMCYVMKANTNSVHV